MVDVKKLRELPGESCMASPGELPPPPSTPAQHYLAATNGCASQDWQDGFNAAFGEHEAREILAALDGLEAPPVENAESVAVVLREQEACLNPATQVFFRAGLIACREYMARFVQAESPSIAASIRANWWPNLGPDFGPPRKIDWNELTDGEYGAASFRVKPREEVSPTLEALPIALGFLEQETFND